MNVVSHGVYYCKHSYLFDRERRRYVRMFSVLYIVEGDVNEEKAKKERKNKNKTKPLETRGVRTLPVLDRARGIRHGPLDELGVVVGGVDALEGPELGGVLQVGETQGDALAGAGEPSRRVGQPA